MRDDHLVKLGEVSGKLDLVIDNQDAHNAKLDALELRLRGVEQRSVERGGKRGGLTGAIVSAAINLAVLMSGGTHPPKL